MKEGRRKPESFFFYPGGVGSIKSECENGMDCPEQFQEKYRFTVIIYIQPKGECQWN